MEEKVESLTSSSKSNQADGEKRRNLGIIGKDWSLHFNPPALG
jgi:hypothetical protein